MNEAEKSLLRAWGVLMALSIALAVAAESARPQRFVLAWTAIVALVALYKARIVLAAYLGLRQAPSVLAGFSAAIAVILAIAVASFALQAALAALA